MLSLDTLVEEHLLWLRLVGVRACWLAGIYAIIVYHLCAGLEGIRIDSSLNLPEQIFLCLGFEGDCASKQHVKNYATRPDISGWPTVGLLGDNLRRHVGWCATEYTQLLL